MRRGLYIKVYHCVVRAVQSLGILFSTKVIVLVALNTLTPCQRKILYFIVPYFMGFVILWELFLDPLASVIQLGEWGR
jgi:hypothetical protein